MLRKWLLCVYVSILFIDSRASNTFISNNDTYWESTSPFTPIYAGLYGHIRYQPTMILSLNIKWNGRVSSINPRWESIIRLGWPSTAGGCKAENSRYPSIWIDKDMDCFHISLSNDKNCGQGYSLTSFPIQPHQTYAMYIKFTENNIFATINDSLVLNETRTAPLQTAHLIGSLMNVYIASDSMNPTALIVANATLSNMKIAAIPPTRSPTYAPTLQPAMFPTFIPSTFPTQFPSTLPTRIITMNNTSIRIQTNPSTINIVTVSNIETTKLKPIEIVYIILAGVASCFCGTLLTLSILMKLYQSLQRPQSVSPNFKPITAVKDADEDMTRESSQCEESIIEDIMISIQQMEENKVDDEGGMDEYLDLNLQYLDDKTVSNLSQNNNNDNNHLNVAMASPKYLMSESKEEIYIQQAIERAIKPVNKQQKLENDWRRMRLLSAISALKNKKYNEGQTEENISSDQTSFKFQYPSTLQLNDNNNENGTMSTLGTTTVNNTYIWTCTRTNSAQTAMETDGKTVEECTGFEWIQLLLCQIDPDDAEMYLEKFKLHRVTDRRLKRLRAEDLKELIPSIGVRNEFEKLLAVKLKMDEEYCE